MKVLIDINIIMDFLCHRKFFFDDANQILKKCVKKEIERIIAAHTVTTIFYLLRKDIPSSAERRAILIDICNIFEVSSVDKVVLLNALQDDSFYDFEDSVQNACAANIEADFIVTSNKKDFENSKLPVCSPDEFLKVLDKDENRN